MQLRKSLVVMAAASLLSISSLLLPINQPEAQAAPNNNPCEKLNVGEVKYPSYGSNRITFATASGYGVSRVLITGCVLRDGNYVQEWQTTGYGGSKGFAPPGKMWEDTFMSPTGSFSFTEALGRSNPGTALSYRTLNPNSKWGGERGPNYNQYFEGSGGPSDENLWDYMNMGYYEQAAVINWNRPPDMPVTQGASFAIFFHAGNVQSAGCISTDLGTVNRLLQSNRPGDRIIMGVESEVFKGESTRTALLESNGDLLSNEGSGWIKQAGGVSKYALTSQRLGILTKYGEFFAKDGGPYGDWKLLATNVKDIAMTETRASYISNGGDLFSKEGMLTADWVHETSGVESVKMAGNRIAAATSDGRLLVKQGSLYADWVVMAGGVASYDVTTSRIGVVGTNGTASVKEGNLYERWVTEAHNVRLISLGGSRIAVVGNDNAFYVKEGSLYADWVLEAHNAKAIDVSQARIAITNNAGHTSAKQGSLYAGWSSISNTASSMQFG